MTLARSQRFLKLLLLVDVEHDAAEMTGQAFLIFHQTSTEPDPMGDAKRLTQAIGKIEIAAAFDGPLDALLRAVAIGRLERGKE